MKNSRELLIEKLLIENYEKYYRLAFSYVHNEADAMDIVQEGAYKAMLKWESLEREDFAETWIYRIMLNEIFSMLRKRTRNEESMVDPDCLEEIPADTPADSLSLRDALDQLQPKEKALVELRYFEDLKLEEIAGALDENLSTVKSRLYRTLRKLRIALEE
ncbi:MAG: sigma-70 family RNA polymerase sigma factor [Anaerovoracaceae bacterium]